MRGGFGGFGVGGGKTTAVAVVGDAGVDQGEDEEGTVGWLDGED